MTSDMPERYADTERNKIINRASSDLENIINGHDPEIHHLDNRVWDRLDKMAVEIECRRAPHPAPVTAREAEPVAWAETYDGGNHYNTVSLTKTRHHTIPLYAHPPQPIETVAEALQLADDMFRDLGWHSKYEITSAALRALKGGE